MQVNVNCGEAITEACEMLLYHHIGRASGDNHRINYCGAHGPGYNVVIRLTKTFGLA